jgi:hypothetical protein
MACRPLAAAGVGAVAQLGAGLFRHGEEASYDLGVPAGNLQFFLHVLAHVEELLAT